MKKVKVNKLDRYIVKPGSRVRLGQWNTDETVLFDGSKREGKERLILISMHLSQLQALLYAEHKHKVLIILQSMDSGGKDGTVRHVFSYVNPQGVRVVNFKAPTQYELDRDFLWRVHQKVPGKGEIGIFNRSHYEDVLIVRVHKMASPAVIKKRFEHINNFERLLVDEGTHILKFYLHISREEQKARLEERLSNPDKNWKFEMSDIEERKLWPAYTKAYEDVLSKTSTPWAPWYIIPSDRKWYRNLVVSRIIINHLEKLRMKYPKSKLDLDGIVVE